VTDQAVPEAYLVVIGDESGRQVHRLDRMPVVVGRAPDSDILIGDPRVSRRHAKISWEDGAYLLEDVGSTNGTWLNEARVTAAARLADGDAISFAGVRAEFQVNAPTMVVASPRDSAAGLRVNVATHEVSVEGRGVALSPKEYLFVAALHRRAGSVASHAELAAEVWPEFPEGVPDENIHQLATRVRRKLEPSTGGARRLITVKGFGYRLASQ
jgi:predicted component of type VI protein secretion system